jgi:hypothetical protein
MCFFYLFICIDPNGGGKLAKIRIFFLKSIPLKLRKIGMMFCGERVVLWIENGFTYICFKRNPLVRKGSLTL